MNNRNIFKNIICNAIIYLQLSTIDLCPCKEARPRVLSVVTDGAVICPMEVGVLESGSVISIEVKYLVYWYTYYT